MDLTTYYMEQNPCYTQAKKMKPAGIVVHDTSAGNPYICRYVEPDDGIIGKNRYGNGWNKPTANKAVHAFIGLDASDEVRTYNVLPWDFKCWGCGGGSKGSFNNSHIQFEICDDGYVSPEYFDKCYREAVELCAYLCRMYSLGVETIVSHKEAHHLGYASDHSDTSRWFGKFSKTMDDFRRDVAAELSDTGVISKATYLLYGPGSLARKLIYLEPGAEVKLTGAEKNGYKKATVTMTYTGYIKDNYLEGKG